MVISTEMAGGLKLTRRSDKMKQPRMPSFIRERLPDHIRGCLIGGAAGDALGYTVDFMREPEI